MKRLFGQALQNPGPFEDVPINFEPLVVQPERIRAFGPEIAKHSMSRAIRWECFTSGSGFLFGVVRCVYC